MALKPHYLFELYKKISEGNYAISPIIVTGFSDLSYTGGIETTKDVITVKFENERVNADYFTNFLGKKARFDNIFSIDDEVKVYGYYDTLPANKDDALIICGRIASFSYQEDNSALQYSMKIINRTEELLNTMVPYSTRVATGTANTAPAAIRQLIARLNQFHNLDSRRRIVAEYDSSVVSFTGSPGGIAALKSDGTAFDPIEYNETWKPIYYNIEKLSSPEYTGDGDAGNYIFYIRYTHVLPQYQNTYGPTVNELVWKPKTQVLTGSLINGIDFTNASINLDVKDIQNMLIVNAGTDLRGAGITGVAYNKESIGKFGMKVGYYTGHRRVFSNIYTQEYNTVISAGSHVDADGFPSDAAGSSAYPLRMSFYERDYQGVYTGSYLVATNKKNWNQYLRDEARWQAIGESNKILDKLGEPKYSVKADMIIGSNTLVLGNIYMFTIPSYGWEGTATNPGYKLRVTNIAHTFNDSGWTSQFDAVEDEKVVSDALGNSKLNVG